MAAKMATADSKNPISSKLHITISSIKLSPKFKYGICLMNAYQDPGWVGGGGGGQQFAQNDGILSVSTCRLSK